MDMKEFLDVGKKLNFDDETLIVKSFRMADTSASGKLDPEEFSIAYNLLYDGAVTDDGDENDVIFVRAMRYGMCKISKAFIMESFVGNIKALEYHINHTNDELSGPFKGTLDTIVAMMISDVKSNKDYGSKVLWWVDIAVSDVLPSVVNKVISAFGLPKDVDTCFYNEVLPIERDSRLRIGASKITVENVKMPVKSLNLFIQSLWLRNLPLVHEVGG